jgi:hypothetical protein
MSEILKPHESGYYIIKIDENAYRWFFIEMHNEINSAITAESEIFEDLELCKAFGVEKGFSSADGIKLISNTVN